MNKEAFLNLNETEQQRMISESGKLLINFAQGDTTVFFYKMEELFVRITTKDDGYRHVEVNHKIPPFKLSDG